MSDPRRLFEAKDMAGAILYAKRVTTDGDAYPLLANANGALIVALTSGTVSIDTSGLATSVGQTTHTTLLTEISTAVRGQLTIGTVTLSATDTTINNGALNPVNVVLTATAVTVAGSVSLTNTKVTVEATSAIPVSGSVSLSSTKVTVEATTPVPVSGSVSLSATKVTVEATTPVPVTLSSTEVTVANGAGVLNVNVRTATLGTVTTSVSNTPTVGALQLLSKTLTGSTGSVSATWTSIFTPTARAKVYALSFTTTSANEVTVLVCDGAFANSKEFWRVTLMAPAGANSGANLAVPPPAYLFATRSTSAVTISLSTAALVHYSIALFDEA